MPGVEGRGSYTKLKMSKCVYPLGEQTYPISFWVQATPHLEHVRTAGASGNVTLVNLRNKAYSDGSNSADVEAYIGELKNMVSAGVCGKQPLSDTCTWSIMIGAAGMFDTSTAGDEFSVALWTYACRAMENIPKSSASVQALPQRASAAFALLASRGAKEGHAQFSAGLPVMFKAYICRAMRMMAAGMGHIVAANSIFATMSVEGGTIVSAPATMHAARAEVLIAGGFIVLHNDTGADGGGMDVLRAFLPMVQSVRAWDLFHRSYYHFFSGSQNEDSGAEGMRAARSKLPPGSPIAEKMDFAFSISAGQKIGKFMGVFNLARDAMRGPFLDNIPLPPTSMPQLNFLTVEAFCLG